jgi:PST family polysaccharide transporter
MTVVGPSGGPGPHDDVDTAGNSDAAGGTPDEAADVRQLRSSAANSAKWAMVQTIAATGGRLLFTFALAAILAPEDFGIVAQAMIYISLSVILLDQGFGVALVQRRRLDDDDVRSVAGLNLLLGAGLTLLTFVLAPYVAQFFRTPELTDVLRVLGVGLVIKGLAIVPLQVCRRMFQFRELALLQTGAVVVGGVTGIVVALNGAGYWSIVVQTMLADVLVLIGLLALRGLPRFGFDVARLKGMLGFSTGLLGSQLLIFAGQNTDNIVIGRVLGPAALAFYALAFRIQRFPLMMIGIGVNDVALSVFSRLQDDRERMAQWFCKATRLVTLLAWPPLVLAAVSAHVAIPFLFGDEWESAIVPMQLLAIAGLSMASRWLFRPLLTAVARTDVLFVWTLIQVVALVVSWIVVVQWGINAVAAAAAVVPVVLMIPQSVATARVVPFSLRVFFAAHLEAAAATTVLGVTWLLSSWALERAGAGALVVLVVSTAVAVACGVVTARAIWPEMFDELRSLVALSRRSRGRRDDASVDDEEPDTDTSRSATSDTGVGAAPGPERGVSERGDQ